jgi:CTP synthase (UTP-ammonia lyase)
MGIADADSAEHPTSSKNLIIAPVTCPVQDRQDGIPKLSGAGKLRLKPSCLLAAIYRRTEIEEEYFCNYEVNAAYHEDLEHAGLWLAAFGENDEVRAVELPDRRFFVATLFQPQLSSAKDRPHPVIVEFLAAAAGRRAAVMKPQHAGYQPSED